MKTMLKLCSRRWPEAFDNIVINLAPYGLGLLIFIRWSCKLQNVIFEFEFRRVGSFLSHSTMMVDEDKTFLKNSSLNYIKGAFLLHLLWYSSLQASFNRFKKIRSLFAQSFIKTPEFPLLLYLLCFLYFLYSSLELEETLDLTSHAIFILKFPSLVLEKLRQHCVILIQIFIEK